MPVPLALESSGTNSNLTAFLCAPQALAGPSEHPFLPPDNPSSPHTATFVKQVHRDSWLARSQSTVRTTVHPFDFELLILDVSLALERGMSQELG